jgi:hypothetical protein
LPFFILDARFMRALVGFVPMVFPSKDPNIDEIYDITKDAHTHTYIFIHLYHTHTHIYT